MSFDQTHDGDAQGNADADKVMWVGNRTHSFVCRLYPLVNLRAGVAVKSSGGWLWIARPGAVVRLITKGIMPTPVPHHVSLSLSSLLLAWLPLIAGELGQTSCLLVSVAHVPTGLEVKSA